jgi:hypothetical protein
MGRTGSFLAARLLRLAVAGALACMPAAGLAQVVSLQPITIATLDSQRSAAVAVPAEHAWPGTRLADVRPGTGAVVPPGGIEPLPVFEIAGLAPLRASGGVVAPGSYPTPMWGAALGWRDRPGAWASGTLVPAAPTGWMEPVRRLAGLQLATSGRIAGHRWAAAIFGFDTGAATGAATGPFAALRARALPGAVPLASRAASPWLPGEIRHVQPPRSHPLPHLDPTRSRHKGFFGKLAWTAPAPIRVEALHYDDNGDPRARNADLEWGWRTSFSTLGAVADLGRGIELRAQGVTGRTRMGARAAGSEWIDMRFRSAYAMLSRRQGRTGLSARVDLFDARNRGKAVDLADDEKGWALALAARREFGTRLAAAVEYRHVASDRTGRTRARLMPGEPRDQMLLAVRASF